MIIIKIIKALIAICILLIVLPIIIPAVVLYLSIEKKTARGYKIKREDSGTTIDILCNRLFPILVNDLGLEKAHIIYNSIRLSTGSGFMRKYDRWSPIETAWSNIGFNILVSSDTVYLTDAADTFAHEMRHVYQSVNSKYTGKYNNSTSDNFIMYYFQAKERDARKYAYEFCKRPDVLAIIKDVYEENKLNNRE